jgi:hypothetical protein
LTGPTYAGKPRFPAAKVSKPHATHVLLRIPRTLDLDVGLLDLTTCRLASCRLAMALHPTNFAVTAGSSLREWRTSARGWRIPNGDPKYRYLFNGCRRILQLGVRR